MTNIPNHSTNPSQDVPEEQSQVHSNVYILNSLIFVAIMIVGGIAFWVLPQQSISTDENRTLTAKPEATQESILSGKYEKQFEEYYNDHFPLRNMWMDFANHLNALKGVQNQEFRVINAPAPQPQAAVAHAAKDGAANPSEQIDDADFNKVKGVIVVNGRVVQNFAGSKYTLSPYTDLLNLYHQTLGPSVKMYAMMIPSGSDFYLPRQVNNGVLKEKENIELFKTLLHPEITHVSAYDLLIQHKQEYIHFYTDHHWTGLGAYYAYVAFAQQAGFTPLSLSQMTHVKREKTFLGSLYNYTKDKALTKNPDTLEYYKIPNPVTVTVYRKNLNKGTVGTLYVDFSNDYGAFLGGDHALTHIKTSNQSQRKILMIKDSFGNALAPYLAAHYDEVFVVDYRYFKGSIPEFMKKHQIGEFLYAHNSFASNSNAAVKYGKAMLKGQ
ncbi:MAG: DHHW family protein [Acinetobacter sp.]|nr:DHHW family protein [Acinetobacter sp.]